MLTGGIYRHVWLHTANTLHITPWGVWTNATVTGQIANGAATDAAVNSETTVVNSGAQTVHFSIRQVVQDASKKTVATASSATYTLAAGANATYSVPVAVTDVSLWSDKNPTLYTLTSEILTSSGSNLDSVKTRFGFRQLSWDPQKGMILNGVPTKIRGLANHQDFAGVGVAVPGIIILGLNGSLGLSMCRLVRLAAEVPSVEAQGDGCKRMAHSAQSTYSGTAR